MKRDKPEELDVETLITRAAEKAANKALEKCTEVWDERFKATVEEVDKRLRVQETKSDSQMKVFAADLATLKQQIAKQGEESSTRCSSAAGQASFSGGQASKSGEHFPGFVEAKGWVVNWKDPTKRAQEMLPEDRIGKLLDEMFLQLTEELQAKVDKTATQECNQGRLLYSKAVMKLMPGTDSKDAWRIRNMLMSNKEKMNAAPDLCKFAVQAAPWKQPHLVASGKFLGMMRSLNVTAEMKSELGPPETVIWHKCALPKILAMWNERKGWSLQADALKEVTKEKVETLMETLRTSS